MNSWRPHFVVALLILIIPASKGLAVTHNEIVLADGVSPFLSQEVEVGGGIEYEVEPVSFQNYLGNSGGSSWLIDHTSRVRGGGTYFDDAFDAQLGVGYSLDMAFAFSDSWSGYLSASHNHAEQGSQYLGTLGLFRQGRARGGLIDRLSGGMLFDQYTDTRFNDFYVSQFRFFLGYSITENLAAGVTYIDPVDGDTSTVGLPGVPGTVTFRTAELVEGYVSTWWGANLLTASAGYRNDLDVMVAGLLLQKKISSTLGTYTGVNFQDTNTWSASWGLELWFGPGARRGASSRRAAGYANYVANNDLVVRGQSGGGSGNPFTDPALGGNLHYDAQTFGSQLVGATMGGIDLLTAEGGGEEELGAQNFDFRNKCDYLFHMQGIQNVPEGDVININTLDHPCGFYAADLK